MGRRAARALWGSEAVAAALAEPAPEPVSAALAAEVERRADPPGALRSWSLAQPWTRFCSIVRIVSGAERRRLLEREPRMRKEQRLNLRLDANDGDRLEALAARLPLVTRSVLARAAIRLGMARIEREGLTALESPDAAPKGEAGDGDDSDEDESAPRGARPPGPVDDTPVVYDRAKRAYATKATVGSVRDALRCTIQEAQRIINEGMPLHGLPPLRAAVADVDRPQRTGGGRR